MITKDISNENNNNNHYIIGSITSSYCFSIKNLEIINNKIKNNEKVIQGDKFGIINIQNRQPQRGRIAAIRQNPGMLGQS